MTKQELKMIKKVSDLTKENERLVQELSEYREKVSDLSLRVFSLNSILEARKGILIFGWLFFLLSFLFNVYMLIS